jgi:hypothetical protein
MKPRIEKMGFCKEERNWSTHMVVREGIHSESSYMKNPVLHFRVLHEMQRNWEFFHYEDGFCNRWMEENKALCV